MTDGERTPLSASDLERIEAELTRRFCPPLRQETVQRALFDSVARFDGAPVRKYLPILVERDTVDRLRRLVVRGDDVAGASQPLGAPPDAAGRPTETGRSN